MTASRAAAAALLLAWTALSASGCSDRSDAPASAPLTAEQGAVTPAPIMPVGSTAAPTTTAESTAAPSSSAATAPPSGSASGAPDPGAGGAAATVTRFYAAYLAAPGRQTAAEYLSPQLTATLFSAARDADPVLCAHVLPNSVAAQPVSVRGGNATVRVRLSQQGAEAPPLTVTVRLSDQRIVAIACPGR